MKALKPLLAALITLSLSAPALAANGTYTQALCFDPNTGAGTGNPPEITRNGGAPFNELWMNCTGTIDSGKGIVFANGLPAHTEDEARGELAYTAPPNVALTGGMIYRAFRARNGNAHWMTMIQHGGPSLDYWGTPRGESFYWYGSNGSDGNFTDRGTLAEVWNAENRVTLAIGGETAWRYTGACTSTGRGGCDGQPSDVVLRIFGGRLALRDASNPQPSAAPTGSLTSDPTLSGVEDVTVNATDVGSGVYRVRLLLDDRLRLVRTIDDNNGHCRDVNAANADPYEFDRAVPCKLSAGGTYSFDTRSLPDGTHNLKVQLEDAGGNLTTIVNRSASVDNVPDGPGGATPPSGATPSPPAGTADGPESPAGAPNGQHATASALLSAHERTSERRRLRVRFGRSITITGRLQTPTGTPVSGAQLQISTQARTTVRAWTPLPPPHRRAHRVAHRPLRGRAGRG